VIQFSPGLEEYALMLAFEDVLRRGANTDVIIYDMAPTALSLRFFSLPGVSLVWLNKLSNVCDLICQKKEIISTIRFGKRELEQDRVKQKLNSLATRHRCLQVYEQELVGLGVLQAYVGMQHKAFDAFMPGSGC
jgi:arsenite/tail-anchored protein-transporting ATPase